jgi:hypothetical protein
VPTNAGEPAQSAGTEEVESVMATARTTRAARTQVVLIVLAIAVGGVVFALAQDFIIGLGVGAAFYALGVRVIKAWGPTDGDTPHTEQPQDREPISQ